MINLVLISISKERYDEYVLLYYLPMHYKFANKIGIGANKNVDYLFSLLAVGI